MGKVDAIKDEDNDTIGAKVTCIYEYTLFGTEPNTELKHIVVWDDLYTILKEEHARQLKNPSGMTRRRGLTYFNLSWDITAKCSARLAKKAVRMYEQYASICSIVKNRTIYRPSGQVLQGNKAISGVITQMQESWCERRQGERQEQTKTHDKNKSGNSAKKFSRNKTRCYTHTDTEK